MPPKRSPRRRPHPPGSPADFPLSQLTDAASESKGGPARDHLSLAVSADVDADIKSARAAARADQKNKETPYFEWLLHSVDMNKIRLVSLITAIVNVLAFAASEEGTEINPTRLGAQYLVTELILQCLSLMTAYLMNRGHEQELMFDFANSKHKQGLTQVCLGASAAIGVSIFAVDKLSENYTPENWMVSATLIILGSECAANSDWLFNLVAAIASKGQSAASACRNRFCS